MITVKDRAIANKSDEIQYFIAIAVVVETTSALWTEGIQPLQRALFISIFPVFNQVETHLKVTANRNDITGIDIKYV